MSKASGAEILARLLLFRLFSGILGDCSQPTIPRSKIALYAILRGSHFKRRGHMRNANRLNIFYLPALILFCVFVVYPFIDGVRISFTDWNGFLPDYEYIGWRNYKTFFQDSVIRRVLSNTIVYGFGSTFFQNIIGLSLALFLDSKFHGRGIVRTVAYLPVMIAPLIMGYIMFFILQFRGGALNDMMILFGGSRVDWLAQPNRTVAIILIVNTLQYMGVSMVIYLAGLQNIPAMYKEAAMVDGVSPWGRFWYVTFPLLIPAISSSVIINLIGGLKLFDIIRALTPPSPSTGAHSFTTYLTYSYFNVQKAGYSSTIGIFTFLLILAITVVTLKYFDGKEVTM